MLLQLASGLYRQAFWMKHYGHMCLKRTLVWSISPAILLLDLGPVIKGIHKSEVKTALKYIDKSGKTRYKGNGKTLKGTQSFSYNRESVLDWFGIPREFIFEICFFRGVEFMDLIPVELRLYPPAFASKIIEHQWDFIADKPQFPDEAWILPRIETGLSSLSFKSTCFILDIPNPMMQALRKDDLLQSLADLETGDPWDDAELWSVYSYVRGSKKLQLPDEYRFLLFTSAS